MQFVLFKKKHSINVSSATIPHHRPLSPGRVPVLISDWQSLSGVRAETRMKRHDQSSASLTFPLFRRRLSSNGHATEERRSVPGTTASDKERSWLLPNSPAVFCKNVRRRRTTRLFHSKPSGAARAVISAWKFTLQGWQVKTFFSSVFQSEFLSSDVAQTCSRG